MQVETFLEILHKAMPTRESLLGYGLDDEDIRHIQLTFIARRRKTFSDSATPELLRMVTDYDCSTLEIGLLQFLSQPQEHPNGIHVANCEADPVVLKPDGTIVMLDHAAPGAEQRCAIDSEHFLGALAQFVEIRANRPAWLGKTNQAITQCTQAAGSQQCEDFYRILCSFLDG